MGWIDHRLGVLPWWRAVPLGLALALSLPAVALVRIGSLVPFELEWALALAPVPEGDWAGTWSSGALTATAMRTHAFDAALALVAGLALVVWSSAMTLAVLGSLRRVAAERPEWALRSALGATRVQLRSELRREGLITSIVAITLSVPLAAAALELGVRLRPAGILVTGESGASLLVGAPVAGLLGATVLAVVILPQFILPAAPKLRRPVGAGMAELRSEVLWLLAAAQVAGSIAIAATAMVLAGAAPAAEIDARHYPHARDTLVLRARLPAGADPAESWQEVRRAVERVRGVEAASVTSPGAILGLGTVDRIAGTCASCRAGGLGLPVTFTAARHLAVDEGYFEVLDLRVRPSASGDVVLGQGVARRLFQSEDPVGQRVWTRGASPLSGPHGSVGLVVPVAVPPPAGPWPAALSGDGSDAPPDVVLVPLADAAPRTADIVLRQSAVRIASVAEDATLVIAGIAPGARVRVVGHLDRLLAEAAQPLRWSALASAGLGTGAFLFAVLGLVAVMAERVRSRRAEIGLRRALGATRPRILRIILADAIRLALASALSGAVLGASISRGLTGLFSGIGPLTTAEVVVLSLLAMWGAVAVSAGEAVRAARMDPVVALRG